jgi:hypothetical protein
MIQMLALVLLASPAVMVVHLPEGCIQPQAAVSPDGTVHVVYYRGPGDAANIYYSRLPPGASGLTPAVRVNSVPNSAGDVGTVRAAQIAVGRGGRVHIAWNGLGPKAANGYPIAYQAYSRSNPAGDSFEEQRNLITWAKGLDGGGTVAADPRGNVFVLWHSAAGAKEEKDGGVFVARSADDGATFARETRADSSGNGACGCCGMRAMVGADGTLEVLYRGARNNSGRDTVELESKDGGQTFTSHIVDPWQLNACPMSTFGLGASSSGTVAAWETAEHVFAARIAPDGAITGKWSPAGKGQKHPSIATGANGTVLAWTEGTGWQRGGSLAWRVIGRDGTPLGGNRLEGAISTWSLPTAVARPDGSFVIVY